MTRTDLALHTPAPTVVLYERATSWLVSSLAGDLDPRRVGVDGDDALARIAQDAFPQAEVRLVLSPEDREWAELVIVLAPAVVERKWYSRVPASDR